MAQLDPVMFDSAEEKRVYRYVDQHGPQAAEDVMDAVSLPADAFQTQVDRLQKKGYLAERDGQLMLGLDIGEAEEFTTADFSYTIRPARPDDFEEIVEVVEEIAGKKTYVVAKELAAQLRYEETLFRHNTSTARVFFVAEADGEIIGWSGIELPLVENLRTTAQLTVGVRDTYRGYAVGTQLLTRGLNWAKTSGAKKVYNNIARTNMRAISFLEDRGWEREGVREEHYTIGHKQVDEVMMAYKF